MSYEIAEKTVALQVGQRVHSILCGGRDGIIVEIRGDELDVVWTGGAMSRRLPLCIVRGVQWRVYTEIVSAEDVVTAIVKAATYKAEQSAKAVEEAKARAAADVVARAAGVALGLVPEAEFKGRGCAAAANLRAELKAANIKARVKQSRGAAIDVYLDDRVRLEGAKAIGLKYKAGSFNGMTDSYEYDSSAWGRVFGDVQYVFFHVDSALA